MRRKILNGIVNAMADTFVPSLDPIDLEVFSGLPDGMVEIDLVAGTAKHSGSVSLQLHVVQPLVTLLRSQLAQHNIALSELATIVITADYRTGNIPTNRSKIVSFDWKCHCRISTDEKQYVGRVAERHLWFTRVVA
jgi:hypothetical protein